MGSEIDKLPGVGAQLFPFPRHINPHCGRLGKIFANLSLKNFCYGHFLLQADFLFIQSEKQISIPLSLNFQCISLLDRGKETYIALKVEDWSPVSSLSSTKRTPTAGGGDKKDGDFFN